MLRPDGGGVVPVVDADVAVFARRAHRERRPVVRERNGHAERLRRPGAGEVRPSLRPFEAIVRENDHFSVIGRTDLRGRSDDAYGDDVAVSRHGNVVAEAV